MTIEKQLKLKQDLKTKLDDCKSKLIDMYNRANTKSKKARIMYDLMSFSEVYQNVFPDEPPLCWDTDKELIDLLLIQDNKCFNTFVNHVNENNELYSSISDNVMNVYSDIKYPFYKNRFVSGDKLFKLSKKEIIDIVRSFLNNYDEQMCKSFSDKVDNLELLYSEISEEEKEYEGFTNNIDCLNVNFISLNLDLGNNINTAVTIVHENAHSFEFGLQYNKNISLACYDTPFTEVCPCFFEYAFLNYLKDNKIYLNDTNLCFDLYFKEIFTSMFEINLLTKMETAQLCESGYLHFNDLEIGKYADLIKEKVNFYDLVELGDDIKVIDSYIYGLGRTFGVYMYEFYKNDPELFKRNLKDVLCSYSLVNDISAFKNVGITKEDLLSEDVLKKELKKHICDFK